MKKRKIEKITFGILKLLPLLLVVVLYLLNFSTVWSTGATVVANDVVTNMNNIMSNFSIINTFTQPIYYLLNTIFGMNTDISTLISNYMLWLVLVELLYVLYDLIIYLPRLLRSLVERGMND